MTLVTGEPFENLTNAAVVLNKAGHSVEAMEFLKQRVQAVPWDFDARMQLAQTSRDADGLRAIAQSNDAPYQVRAAAAAKASPLNTASAELNALSAPPYTPAAAEKPYLYAARIEAAIATTDPVIKIRLLRAAIAIDPAPEKPRLDLVRAALAAKRGRLRLRAPPGYLTQTRP